MEKIKTWFHSYLKKNSTIKIIGDVVFYLLIILMIIPSTRRELSAFLIRATLRKPHVKTESLTKLSVNDYRFFMEDLDGKSYVLTDFSDKVIILNFWATWCPPCRAEMPSIQKLFDEYGKKVNFVLVTSEEPGKVKEFMNESNYTFPVYIQRSPLPPAFPVSSIPTTFVISKDGKILVDKKGAANWDSMKFQSQLDDLIHR